MFKRLIRLSARWMTKSDRHQKGCTDPCGGILNDSHMVYRSTSSGSYTVFSSQHGKTRPLSRAEKVKPTSKARLMETPWTSRWPACISRYSGVRNFSWISVWKVFPPWNQKALIKHVIYIFSFKWRKVRPITIEHMFTSTVKRHFAPK